MARPLRIEYDGALYHITARGNERKSIYKDDEDRAVFLDALQLAERSTGGVMHRTRLDPITIMTPLPL